MITGISEFGFFGPKMAVSWRITFFQKNRLKPLFYSVFGCAFSGPSCQKRQFLDTHPKKNKILTDNWKALFLVFLCFFTVSFFLFWFFVFVFFCFFFCFLFLCFFFFGGFKGQVRWPEGPPHLALNPPYFLFVFLFFCWFLLVFVCFFCLRVRWGGRRATSLGPKPSLFVFFFWFLSFLCF